MIERRALLGGAASVAAFAALGGRARAADPVVRIATLPLDASACCFYAEDQGLYKAAHLDAHVQTIANGGAIVAAVTSGAVEVGFTNMVSAATAFKRGVPITIVAEAKRSSRVIADVFAAIRADGPRPLSDGSARYRDAADHRCERTLRAYPGHISRARTALLKVNR